MLDSTSQSHQDLEDVVAQIQAAKRSVVRSQIQRLQAALGSTTNLFVDRRTLRAVHGSGPRARFKAAIAGRAAPQKNYLVQFRDGVADHGDPLVANVSCPDLRCTLDQVAKLLHKKPSTIRNYLSAGDGSFVTRRSIEGPKGTYAKTLQTIIVTKL